MQPRRAGKPVEADLPRYALDPECFGEDAYTVISRGHHDIHTFMREVRKYWEWPLGVPAHIWMKTMPARDGSRYVPVPAGTRGAWPCTYVSEAYNENRYEAHFPHADAIALTKLQHEAISAAEPRRRGRVVDSFLP